MMRIFVAFVVLTALLTGALLYTYYKRRSILVHEGFQEEDITVVENQIREAIPQLDQATLARIMTIIKRLAATVLNPTFFTDAVRRSGMSPMDMARDYIKSQSEKAKS
jgi:hypothetical protein